MPEIVCEHCGHSRFVADRLSIHFMTDGFTFKKLSSDPDAAIEESVEFIKSGRGTYGMLCPASVLCGSRELRRVGQGAHARRADEDGLAYFREQAARWKCELLADKEAAAIIAASADTHPKGGDVEQAPLVSGATAESRDAQGEQP